MKMHARVTLAAALAAAIIGAMTQAPAAFAGDADAHAARPSAGATTLFVEDPRGNAFRLVHVEGAGWKYGPVAAERQSLFRKVALLGSRGEPQSPATEVPAEAPLTVFIDGPSGFVYAWNQDGGWTFIGKLAARRQ